MGAGAAENFFGGFALGVEEGVDGLLPVPGLGPATVMWMLREHDEQMAAMELAR